MDEVAALPITGGFVVRRLVRYYDRLRLPPGSHPTSRFIAAYRDAHFHRIRSRWAG